MERQLASLTGIVQKALSTTSPSESRPQSLVQDFDVNPTKEYSNDGSMYRTGELLLFGTLWHLPRGSLADGKKVIENFCDFFASGNLHAFSYVKMIFFNFACGKAV